MAETRKLSPAGRRMVAAYRARQYRESSEGLRQLRDLTGEDIRDLMGSEDVEPGLERGDGFFVAHEVRVTEPWHVSLVRLDERPRASVATSNLVCGFCGAEYRGITRSRYCGAKDCNRGRAAERKARQRAAG